MKRVRGAGLGDPDDAGEPAPAGVPGLLAAAQETASEAARLREVVRRFTGSIA